MCPAWVLFLLLVLTGVVAAPLGCQALLIMTSVSAYDDFGLTTSGAITSQGTVAAGRDIPFNSVVVIPRWGVGVVQDRGDAITNGHVDLWMPTYKQAIEWGRKELPVIVLLP